LAGIGAELIRRLPVAIGSVASVLRVVLPVAALAIDVAVEIIVTIKIIVVVNVDVATIPIAIAPVAAPSATPGSRTQRNSGAPH
jgi:hypothetical protein